MTYRGLETLSIRKSHKERIELLLCCRFFLSLDRNWGFCAHWRANVCSAKQVKDQILGDFLDAGGAWVLDGAL